MFPFPFLHAHVYGRVVVACLNKRNKCFSVRKIKQTGERERELDICFENVGFMKLVELEIEIILGREKKAKSNDDDETKGRTTIIRVFQQQPPKTSRGQHGRAFIECLPHLPNRPYCSKHSIAHSTEGSRQLTIQRYNESIRRTNYGI